MSSTTPAPIEIRIEPWAETDLALLELINTEEMRRHVGGPETPEKLLIRHQRYLDFPGLGTGQMFRVVAGEDDTPVGSVGYHSREWQGERVFEMGWNVLPPFRGLGIAHRAALAGALAAARTGQHHWLHAFPSVDNAPSNAVCRRVGFALLGETDFEYPPGRFMRSNDWRLDLTALTPGSS
ncbi:GNAT family N-acetyltransferase [Kitasatospora viridis]|uniref:RimJ/RimL family protein N-acetyltransferase n=1 Tax=Kitasatospora viridis TaxID=281105 RepID=A0A561UD06_9ACTN|nr:GNAT family N-acetyltransferase [Kitasatospora viridis]TWF97239.1 RimJ/RimL family protein N-acetyltransferase [Kitasatospora viridis]